MESCVRANDVTKSERETEKDQMKRESEGRKSEKSYKVTSKINETTRKSL